MEEKIKVIKVEPRKEPEVVMLKNEYKDLSVAVGGLIQVVYPYSDKVGLMLNDEGKLLGMEPNRSLKDEDGNTYDIIAGTFYVVGLDEENFGSLSDELIEKYMKEFKQPYMYVQLGMGVLEIPIHIVPPDDKRKTEEVIKKGQVLDFGPL